MLDTLDHTIAMGHTNPKPCHGIRGCIFVYGGTKRFHRAEGLGLGFSKIRGPVLAVYHENLRIEV